MVLGNKNLAYLTVDSRGISPADASLVASFFRHWNGVDCGIVCLSLDGVVLGSAFSLFITRFLSNNTNLVELELGNAELTKEDARDFASILSLETRPSSLRGILT